MAHANQHSVYTRLAKRLNRFPQGAPASDLLFSILKLLFSEKEAGLVAQLPIRPFVVDDAGRAWKMDLLSTRRILDGLAARALLVDMAQNGKRCYCLPPPMVGFFEFSLMRVRGDIDQKVLSELYFQYINVEEDFIKALFLDSQTPLGRVFVQEPALSEADALHVLDYERVSEVIGTASHIGISLCYCRHKMAHVGRDCVAPNEICMTINTAAASLIRHGHARPVDAAECRDLLDRAYAANLVQFGENVQQGVNFICNCCGCCCEAMLAIQRFGLLRPIHSNFIARIHGEDCTGCGRCAAVCPVRAIIREGGGRPAAIDASMCLGCGVCIRNCPASAIGLESRPGRVLTPVDTVRRTVLMAIERGTLQHLIFDNRLLFSHQALAAVVGVILKLPPVKRPGCCNRAMWMHCLTASRKNGSGRLFQSLPNRRNKPPSSEKRKTASPASSACIGSRVRSTKELIRPMRVVKRSSERSDYNRTTTRKEAAVWNNSILKKMVANKIADCLDGEPEGLQSLFKFYREKNIRLDSADQHFIDNPAVLRDAVHKHGAMPGHLGCGDLVDNPATVQWIDDYARRFAKLVDPEWEKMINTPENRWYKEGAQYQELFHDPRLGENSLMAEQKVRRQA